MTPVTGAFLSLLLLLLAATGGCGGRGERAGRPNVLLYVVDTLRADAIGPYAADGEGAAQTPHLDRLAAEGVLFERAWATAPWTRASVASLLTGLDPDALGVEGRDAALPEGAALVAEAFQRAGYQTASFVANPNVGPFFGFARGFDDTFQLYHRRSAQGPVQARELVARSEDVAERLLLWLDVVPEPFFAFVLVVDPHGPYTAPPGFEAEPRPGLEGELATLHARYLAEVAYADHAFGRVLDALEERRLAQRTLVAFTSDHGEEFEEHGERGHGTALYEESLRVPLILRLPGALPAGRRVPAPVSLVDVAPTLLTLAGLDVPAGIAGRTLPGTGATSGPREPAGDERGVYASVELGEHRGKSLTQHPWKLVSGTRPGGTALFHLERDPGETRDLAAAHPEEAGRLAAALAARSKRNRERRSAWADESSVHPTELPPEARAALEVLGYIEPEGDATAP